VFKVITVEREYCRRVVTGQFAFEIRPFTCHSYGVMGRLAIRFPRAKLSPKKGHRAARK